MSTLIFDTETDGLPNFRSEAGAHQPHIVQLSAALFDADGEVVAALNLLVKPNGWTIPPEAIAVHGITNEMCEEYGLPIVTVIKLLMQFVRRCELLVAHSLDFDKLLVWSELIRLQLADDLLLFVEKPTFCTMKATTPICKLPGKFGNFKWPKLVEAYQHIFGETFEDAHDAFADMKACGRIYFWLLKQAAPVAVKPTIETE